MRLAWGRENDFWKGCSAWVRCEAGTVDTVVASNSFRLPCGFLHDIAFCSHSLLHPLTGDFVLKFRRCAEAKLRMAFRRVAFPSEISEELMTECNARLYAL